jgi:hypothetical protein
MPESYYDNDEGWGPSAHAAALLKLLRRTVAGLSGLFISTGCAEEAVKSRRK